MWWWWFFTCAHPCMYKLWFKSINAYNVWISLYGQFDILFDMIISCTCDLHFELQLLCLVNIKNHRVDFLKILFPYSSKYWIFLPSKFSYGLLCNLLHSIHYNSNDANNFFKKIKKKKKKNFQNLDTHFWHPNHEWTKDTI